MTAFRQDFNKLYSQAFSAYGQGQYEEAATMIERLDDEYPDNPQICLLKAHIQYVSEQYQLAHQNYERVMTLALGNSQEAELINCAQDGIVRTGEFLPLQTATPSEISLLETNNNRGNLAQTHEGEKSNKSQNIEENSPFVPEEINNNSPTFGQSRSVEEALAGEDSTFGWSNHFEESSPATFAFTEDSSFDVINDSEDSTFGWSNHFEESSPATFALTEDNSFDVINDSEDSTFGWSNHFEESSPATFALSSSEEDSFLESKTEEHPISNPLFASSNNPGDIGVKNEIFNLNELDIPLQEGQTQIVRGDNTSSLPPLVSSVSHPPNTASEEPNKTSHSSKFIDLPSISPSFDFFSETDEDLISELGVVSPPNQNPGSPASTKSISPIQGAQPWVAPSVEVKQGAFAWFQNAPLNHKKWYIAAIVGAVSTLSVLIVGGLFMGLLPKSEPTTSSSGNKVTLSKNQKGNPKKTTSAPAPLPKKSSSDWSGGNLLLLALTGGLAGFGTSLFLGHLALEQTKRSIQELLEQFESIRKGNFDVRATVFSGDELGILNADFNNLSLTMFNQVQNVLQHAAEMEEARDSLQQQVIRLLDNVEGAARGDLTVEAEVTADVLGTVADAFNLTIKNLRDIVSQVKKAAQQVNKGSKDSELFARKNSSDARSMAEEVAVTLNSVHLISESVQRVAANAKEAQEVALSSSVTAIKGGEAVERTVAGVLQIRETVSETARKVKRLAEASQEISKIVALVSQIASRTNLLALNASIQAARAGEAGRGFAVVADEVRQLADRSAKSLKEIEQIVLQIQGETGSVMTAMEEGIQQVIDVTDKSEQAKRSLEDIIAVSKHINTLVRSISTDTVKQQETSVAVAQVMRWVDVTAQGTAQESQQVAGSLQSLVSISQELLASVERFRVDTKEKN